MWKPLARLGVGTAPPSPLAAWPLGRFVEWRAAWGSGAIAVSGLDAGIERRKCGDGRPVSEACAEGDSYVTANVVGPGMAPAILEGAAGVRWFVGVGPLGPKA